LRQTRDWAPGAAGFVKSRRGQERNPANRMRRLIVSNLVSLDGFFEGPNHELDWHVLDEEFFAYANDMLRNADTLLFGRSTYQLMASYWPAAPPDEIANQMNGLPKLVFSSTLKTADWNNCRLVTRDAAAEISSLKQLPGKDLLILGSAQLASSLLNLGLIDEYRVIINPVLIGNGKPLFPALKQRIRLKLSHPKVFASGVIILYYHRALLP
jgi:dihydrofolate reductase